MKKFTFSAILLVAFFLVSTANMFGQVLPDDWTGDSGIDTYEETTIVYSGSSSCKIDVNTGSQSSCDLSNDVEISVTAGDTYTYTFWAYTSDHVKVRGILDWTGANSTYAGYVDPASGGWVQFTYSDVVPTGATGVKLRLRCYDVSGFTAPETQYVDDVEFESPTGTTLTVSNGDFESWPSASAIATAYAISETAMDVVYGTAMTTVNAADYSLSGTASITFSGAAIDGTDANLVHLTGASTNMVGDITVDNIADAANATNFDFYAGILPVSYVNTLNPGGTMNNTNIATFTGIVSADDGYNNVWFSDAAGGYNGTLIYDGGFDDLVSVGDEILFYANRDVYNSLSELKNPGMISVVSTGNSPFGPDIIDGSDIDDAIAADANPAEKWEGQFVKIENFTVDSYVDFDYTCSWSDGTTTYHFHIGDNVDYQLGNISLNIGDTYNSISGVIDWYNSGPYFRINPREQSDIVSGGAATARIVGSMNGWNTTDPDYVMSQNANGIYELTKSLDAGDHEYKVLEGDDWSAPNYPGTNQHVILTATENVTWKANIDAELVTHLNPVVAGDFLSAIGGNDWDPSELMGEMTDSDGDDIFTLELTIPAGNYEAKVTLNHNWDQSTGGNIPFTTDGVNPTTFTYDFPNNVTTISGPPPPTATITFIVDNSATGNYDGFFLKGSWDANGQYDPSWGGGMEHSEFYDDGTHGDVTADDHIWTCQQDLVVDNGSNTWEWGVNDTESNWVAGNWQFTIPDQTAQTLTWTVSDVINLVINEIMYNSPGADEEWIELYNNTDQTIDLENWDICDDNASHDHIIIPAGYSIAPYGYFTISIATGGAFPFTPDYDGTGNFSLKNSTDAVRVWNPDHILVDIVVYDDGSPWPTEPDGDGPSLSLIDPDTDNSLGESWAASTEDGGTPGELNFPPVPFVTVVTPNGGEFIEQGEAYDITWIYGFWTGNVDIKLVKGAGNPQLLVSNISIEDGSWTWNVFTTQEIGNDYKIMIVPVNPDDPSDESDDFFSIIEQYIAPEIVITEIMYNPPESGSDSLEFLELFNNGTDAVNLEGFYFSEGVEYVFPSIDLLPDNYLLVSIDSVAMMSTFGVEARQWTGGALKNSGEDIVLNDSFDNIIDSLTYDDNLPWDTLADGYGPSLTLCNPDVDNSVAENWTHSVNFMAVNAEGDSIWATPGFGCAVVLLAGFEADVTTVSVGESVQFTDLTIGDPIEWTWTFEGGTPDSFSGQTPPPIFYNAEGDWNVTLLVSDGVNTDEITYENYITVVNFPAPTNLVGVVGPYDDVQLTWNAFVEPGFEDDFESYDDFVIDFAPWTNIDVDGSTTYGMTGIDWPNAYLEQSFIIFNPSQTTPPVEDIIPHSGDKIAACFASTTPPNNDWLITPLVGLETGYYLSFWAKSYTADYGLERFRVGVSVTGMDPEDFTIISDGEYLEAPVEDWTEFTFDLSAYDGQNVYVAIQCVSNDAFILLVDDFYIGASKSTIVFNPTQPVVGKITKSTGFSTTPSNYVINTNRSVAAELLGYNVYRDDIQINTDIVEVTEYNDAEPTIGSHDYYVTAVYDGGESGPSNVVSIVVTDVNQVDASIIAVYPNPTSGFTTIQLDANIAMDIAIIDITGKEVYNNSIVGTTEINISGLQNGLYFIRLHDELTNNTLVKKLIIK